MKNKLLYISLLLVFIASAGICSEYVQQSALTGTVILTGNQSPLGNTKVSLDGENFITSNRQGEFTLPTANVSSRPKEVYAKKQGYELANWEFEKGNLTIYMRPATIKTINGLLTTGFGKPYDHQILVLMADDKEFTTYTNTEGKFVLKIPYHIQLTGANKFILNNIPLVMNSFEEDKESAHINVTLSAQDNTGKSKTSLVMVKYKNEVPVKNVIVGINETSYITNEKGEFRAEKLKSADASWDFEGLEPITIDTNYQTEVITVILNKMGDEPDSDKKISSRQDTRETSMDSSQIARLFKLNVSEEVNRLLDFYNQQSKEIEERNKGIARITDSLMFFTNFDDKSRQEFMSQLDALNKSIEITSNDFEEIKSNSLMLIKRLRSILVEQEEIIQEIEEEKAAQELKFRRNVMLFIYFFGIASSLLVIAIFVARRLSAQKKVIEQMKDQLSEAQLIAKIGSMTYLFKKARPVFSEHFFEILGIHDDRRINKIIRSSNQYISPELLEKKDILRLEKAFQEALVDEKPINLEIKTITDRKKELHVDLRSKIEFDKNGNPTVISSTLQDITEKKEKELLLMAANKEAEEANKTKEQFLSTMSHEIRTPLNAIIGLTNQLIKNKPAKHQITNLRTLQFSGEHLLTLINDILDYSKIQAGRIKLEEAGFNLTDSVSGVINSMELMSKEKGVQLISHIEKDIAAFVTGDKLRLNQVLTNLISNGIKFTDKGTVSLSVSLKNEKKDKLTIHFSVRDTGRGIARHRIDKIFDGFEQEDPSIARKYGGTGLGLSISKQLVTLLGGELKVKSEVGKGSEFYFDAIFKKSDGKPVHRSNYRGSGEDNLENIRILCVEDNDVNQLVISQYFQNWNIAARYATTGKQALEMLKKHEFDLIFMDIRLPDMTGFEVTELYLEGHPESTTPIVALTAETNDSFIEKFKNSTMVAYLNKPFMEEELKNTIIQYAINHPKRG